MLDLKWIRNHPEALDAALARRGMAPAAATVLALDKAHRESIARLQEMQTRRNALSTRVGQWRREGRVDEADGVRREIGQLKQALAAGTGEEKAAAAALDKAIAALPNILDPTVPDGRDETGNREIRRWGDPPHFTFTPRDHVALGEGLGMMDFATAARISGARFVVLTDALARLERGLAQFMLDIATREFGYREVSGPLLVRTDALFGTGQLPKFASDLFQTGSGHWLIPTAEVSLTNLVREQVLAPEDLPLRHTAWTSCFRSEAGAAGQDTRGMLRQHQFYKVELVSITLPEQSAAEHRRKIDCAETVLQRLALPYRLVHLCSGDTGQAMRSTCDLEVWLPGQNRFREIASVSSAGDYQARRMRTRFRLPSGQGNGYPHTLNGSGVAIGRALIALLENGQRQDGSIGLPEALHPWLGGMTEIRRP